MSRRISSGPSDAAAADDVAAATVSRAALSLRALVRGVKSQSSSSGKAHPSSGELKGGGGGGSISSEEDDDESDEPEAEAASSDERARLNSSLRGAAPLLCGYGVCPGEPESTDSSPSPPKEASRPVPGVEQAGGGAEPNPAALRSETADLGETRESSSSGHSRGRGGSRRASGGEEDSGEDEAALR